MSSTVNYSHNAEARGRTLKRLHTVIASLEEDLKRRLKEGTVAKDCYKVKTQLDCDDDDVLVISIFDGPANETTSIIEPGLIVRYCGGRQLNSKARSLLVKELGL